jgi:hypothetical protein
MHESCDKQASYDVDRGAGRPNLGQRNRGSARISRGAAGPGAPRLCLDSDCRPLETHLAGGTGERTGGQAAEGGDVGGEGKSELDGVRSDRGP